MYEEHMLYVQFNYNPHHVAADDIFLEQGDQFQERLMAFINKYPNGTNFIHTPIALMQGIEAGEFQGGDLMIFASIGLANAINVINKIPPHSEEN